MEVEALFENDGSRAGSFNQRARNLWTVFYQRILWKKSMKGIGFDNDKWTLALSFRIIAGLLVDCLRNRVDRARFHYEGNDNVIKVVRCQGHERYHSGGKIKISLGCSLSL